MSASAKIIPIEQGRETYDLGDRVPPQNIEAEESALGSILLDSTVFDDVAAIASVEDFYRDNHQIVFRAFGELVTSSKPIDPVTLAEWLMAHDLFRQVGGEEFIRRLCEVVPHAANAEHYAQIVRQKSMLRQSIEVGNAIIRDGYSGMICGEDMISSAETRLLAIQMGTSRRGPEHASIVSQQTMARLQSRCNGEVIGKSTGFKSLDVLHGGFEPESLCYIGGRASMGKSALAANIANYNAVGLAVPTLYVTLESSRYELMQRLYSIRTGIPSYRLKKQRLNQDEYDDFQDSIALIESAPLFIDDTSGQTAAQIASTARRYKMRQGIEMVIIDLINHVVGDSRLSTRERFGHASKTFKGIARQLQIPVIVLAQISRASEATDDKRPRMSHLKESGDLEEDADSVFLIFRPEYYDPNDQPGVAEIIVAKNRDGDTGTAILRYERSCVRFSETPADQEYIPPAAF